MKKVVFITATLALLLLAACQAPQSGRAIQVPGPDYQIQFANGPTIVANANYQKGGGVNYIFFDNTPRPEER